MNRVLASPRLPLFGALAFALAAVFAAACGDDDVGPPGPGPVAIEAYRAELEGADCDFAVRCGLMPDRQTCLALDRASDETLQLISSAVFGDVRYDATKARVCVEARRTRSCEELLSIARQVEAACKGVFTGSAPEGGPCLVAGECAAEGVCDRSACAGTGDACCLGACAPLPAKAPVGGDCSAVPCVDEAYCDQSDGSEGGGGGGMAAGTCVVRVDNGQACTDSNGCKDGQRCGDGKCYILSKEGGQCNPGLERACLSIDDWCDPASSKCVKLPAAGQPCTPGSNRCQGHAYCDAGTCRLRPKEGEACTGEGPHCLGDLRCEMNVCVAPGTPRVCVSDAQ